MPIRKPKPTSAGRRFITFADFAEITKTEPEKSYVLATADKYTFRVHDKAHKTQIKQAVEALFDVHVVEVRTSKVPSKPKRRGVTAGRTRAWKKAVVQVRPGETIPIFQGLEADL